jgi:hypothetical protein
LSSNILQPQSSSPPLSSNHPFSSWIANFIIFSTNPPKIAVTATFLTDFKDYCKLPLTLRLTTGIFTFLCLLADMHSIKTATSMRWLCKVRSLLQMFILSKNPMQETEFISVTTVAKMLHSSITASDYCSAAKIGLLVCPFSLLLLIRTRVVIQRPLITNAGIDLHPGMFIFLCLLADMYSIGTATSMR